MSMEFLSRLPEQRNGGLTSHNMYREDMNKIIEKHLQEERIRVEDYKKRLRDKPDTKMIPRLTYVTNRWRALLRKSLLYTGIPTKDSQVINKICEVYELNEEKKKQLIEGSGEEKYSDMFRHYLKEGAEESQIAQHLKFQLILP